MGLFPHASLVYGLILAFVSAVAFNWSWVEQHTITSQLPKLTVRDARRSLGILFGDRRWRLAFLVGIVGWALYIFALRLAPLSLVQAVSAGGLGLLAILAQRAEGTPLPRREWAGVGLAVLGLVFLSVSLAGGSSVSSPGNWVVVAAWFVVSLVLVAVSIGPAARLLAPGAGWGIAAGLTYAAADVGTKEAVHGGVLLLFIAPIWIFHGLAFCLIQLAFQRGRALATAGLSSFCTNALPIVGGIAIFHERTPPGALGVIRFAAFGCVVVGAAAVARRETGRLEEEVVHELPIGSPAID
jgi:drug/metabolite transporter (DMT)-like permease